MLLLITNYISKRVYIRNDPLALVTIQIIYIVFKLVNCLSCFRITKINIINALADVIYKLANSNISLLVYRCEHDLNMRSGVIEGVVMNEMNEVNNGYTGYVNKLFAKTGFSFEKRFIIF